tara:strand:- start:15 stop:449 length:435 start_codon:yes stop_codon:yes gene_type:complete
MPINSNNNAVFVADTTSLGEVAQEYFTVVVKDSSGTAVDIDGNTHKDGIVDRILQGIQTRGTLRYYNITTTNGTLTVAIERANTWEDSDPDAISGTPTATAAANLQVFLRAMGVVSCRLDKDSTESDTAKIDVGGTTVAVVANV